MFLGERRRGAAREGALRKRKKDEEEEMMMMVFSNCKSVGYVGNEEEDDCHSRVKILLAQFYLKRLLLRSMYGR
jgi:hypothetical protein